MNTKPLRITILVVAMAFSFVLTASAQDSNPLPSWNDGKARQSIVDFVAKVTKQGSPDFDAKGWTVVDMKQDWKVIFPLEKK
jgi:hypothetical protein